MYQIARLRCSAWQLLLAALGLYGSIAPCAAQIRESTDHIVGIVAERTIEQSPGWFPAFPPKLSSDRDAYLLIRAGAAVYDVRVLARPSVDPHRLAQVLDSAVRDLYPGGFPVEW